MRVSGCVCACVRDHVRVQARMCECACVCSSTACMCIPELSSTNLNCLYRLILSQKKNITNLAEQIACTQNRSRMGISHENLFTESRSNLEFQRWASLPHQPRWTPPPHHHPPPPSRTPLTPWMNLRTLGPHDTKTAPERTDLLLHTTTQDAVARNALLRGYFCTK